MPCVPTMFFAADCRRGSNSSSGDRPRKTRVIACHKVARLLSVPYDLDGVGRQTGRNRAIKTTEREKYFTMSRLEPTQVFQIPDSSYACTCCSRPISCIRLQGREKTVTGRSSTWTLHITISLPSKPTSSATSHWAPPPARQPARASERTTSRHLFFFSVISRPRHQRKLFVLDPVSQRSCRWVKRNCHRQSGGTFLACGFPSCGHSAHQP